MKNKNVTVTVHNYFRPTIRHEPNVDISYLSSSLIMITVVWQFFKNFDSQIAFWFNSAFVISIKCLPLDSNTSVKSLQMSDEVC